jgi:hypothetical protein
MELDIALQRSYIALTTKKPDAIALGASWATDPLRQLQEDFMVAKKVLDAQA